MGLNPGQQAWRERGRIIMGSASEMLKELPDESVHCCVTSPPYWGLRDYGMDNQIGLEATPAAYIEALMPVFEDIWRVLRNDGTLWLNLGDTYIGYHGNKNAIDGPAPSDGSGYRENMRPSTVGTSGLRNKSLAGIPWRVVFSLQDCGWILRSDIIWHKPNPAPESVKDRPTRSHEYLFLLTKSEKYFYDYQSVREKATSNDRRVVNRNQARNMRGLPRKQPNKSTPTHPVKVGTMGSSPDGKRNRRTVWTIAPRPFSEAHFATFPPDLIRPCIRAGCPAGGVVLDPFFGSGTVGQVCIEEKRKFIGIELNPEYVAMAEKRLANICGAPEQVSLWEQEMVAL